MLSRELELTLNFAFKDARRKKHELISVEHLLFALLDNPLFRGREEGAQPADNKAGRFGGPC